MKHNCSIFQSHYKTEVRGAAWSGEVAEQEEVPQEGDQAGADRHHGLHHLLAASLGHPDSSHQVSPASRVRVRFNSQLMSSSSSSVRPIGKQFIGRKSSENFKQFERRLTEIFCISANLPATTRATPSLSSSSSPTACSTATPPSTPSSTLSSRTTSRRVSARRVTATRGR